jgi:hypothetical protein
VILCLVAPTGYRLPPRPSTSASGAKGQGEQCIRMLPWDPKAAAAGAQRWRAERVIQITQHSACAEDAHLAPTQERDWEAEGSNDAILLLQEATGSTTGAAAAVTSVLLLSQVQRERTSEKRSESASHRTEEWDGRRLLICPLRSRSPTLTSLRVSVIATAAWHWHWRPVEGDGLRRMLSRKERMSRGYAAWRYQPGPSLSRRPLHEN